MNSENNLEIAVLRDSEKRYQAILDTMNHGVQLNDCSGTITYINRAQHTMLGYEADEILGKKIWDMVPSSDEREALKNLFAVLVKDQPQPEPYFAKNLKKDGTRIDFQIDWDYERDEAGVLTGFISVITDITQRRQTEHALKEREKFLSIIFDAIQDGISVLDRDFNVVQVNKTMRKWYAHMLPFEGNKKCYEVYHGRTSPCEICPTRKTLKSGKLEKEEVYFVKAEGVTGTLELFTFPITDEISGEIIGVVEYVRDVTAQREAQRNLEDERLKTQRLESTGVLAGGIAHDFNNILTAIIGNISLAKIYAGANVELMNKLTSAEKAAIRAGDLSQQLLTFSKGGNPVRKATELSELIRDSAFFALTGTNVSCRFQMAPNLWLADVDEGQISQVIQNVVKNADQAMPDGGTVTVQVENTVIGQDSSLPLKKGMYLWIQIKDHGSGILEENLRHIFDPYFSTKSGGSGLGLAVVFSIVKKHDGFITAESKTDAGTTFHIYLPAAEGQVPVGDEQAKEGLYKSGGKILVMDDDLSILDVVTQMLGMMGFVFETAVNGQEAVTLYRAARAEGKPFDAVILDLTVPGGMGGEETLKQLVDIDPGVNAMVSSGYSNDSIMADYKRYGFRGCVSKPYDMKKLGKALRELFD